jgi:hypothetical protein
MNTRNLYSQNQSAQTEHELRLILWTNNWPELVKVLETDWSSGPYLARLLLNEFPCQSVPNNFVAKILARLPNREV